MSNENVTSDIAPEDVTKTKTETIEVETISATSDDGKTIMERKMHLVNQEFDRQGMGKYQWAIFWLCCYGYFLDLAWAMASGM